MGVDIEPSVAAKTPEEAHDDENDNPRVAFIVVHQVVTDEAGNHAEHANDDDANNER